MSGCGTLLKYRNKDRLTHTNTRTRTDTYKVKFFILQLFNRFYSTTFFIFLIAFTTRNSI